jgi:molybdopterin-guanine dinucleotide biosynthesis protein A
MNSIILSGGNATRLNGIDKAFLTLGDETLIQRKLRLLRPLFQKIITVTNNPQHYGDLDCTIVQDQVKGMGPLMGIYSGLNASDSHYNFFTTVDTPFLIPELATYFRDLCQYGDGAVAQWNGMTEPLCAVYSKSCLPAIERAMPKRRIVSFYDEVDVHIISEKIIREIDPEGFSFININTWQDYEQAQHLVLQSE